MSNTGVDVAPNLPKCPILVLPTVYTVGKPGYVPYLTHHSLCAVQEVPFGLSTEKKVKNAGGESPFELERKQIICISYADSYANPIQSFISCSGCKNKTRLLVQIETGFWLCEIGRGDGTRGHLFVCSCDSSTVQLGFWT